MPVANTVKFTFALKLLWRDWKSGELNILAVSLLLAIATVTSISLFTSKIHNSIYEEASHFLAADAKISGTQAIPNAWVEEAQQAALTTAQTMGFRAMAFSAEEMLLTQVKAVSTEYPLKGQLSIANTPDGASRNTTEVPKIGEAWLAPRLFNALNVTKGDAITIGEARFIVAAALTREPDSGQSLFGVAPRVMINMDDVSRTEAVQVGSRVDYALLLAGNDANLKRFQRATAQDIGHHHRWRDATSDNRSIGDALDRAEQFLLLTGCLSVVLTGVAIALAARRFAQRQQSQVAILKTLGTAPKQIIVLYSIIILAIGGLSLGVGAFLGWLSHWGIIYALGDLMPKGLSQASLSAYGNGALAGFVALWAFAAPPIFALRHISPGSILREEQEQLLSTHWTKAIGGIALIVLMLIYSQDLMLTLIICAGALVCFIGVNVLSSLLIRVTKQLSQGLSYKWRLGFASLKRHQAFNTLQITIFALLFMLLFILINVRTTLIGQWQSQIPPETPNHFAFNIFPEDIDSISRFFEENGIKRNPYYPMTRGRLTHVNEAETKALSKNADNNMNYQRELNLTWSSSLGKDNEIVSGEWWDDRQAAEPLMASVEAEYANGLNIEVGDTLKFSVAGQIIEAKVRSLRSVEWDSMNPNFFVIFNKEMIIGSGANWITSFYLSETHKTLLNSLARQFPTISFVEIDQTIRQVQGIIAKVSLAIEFILLLVLASGILVLLTSIQATLDIRKKEGAIFRTLGANKSLIRLTLVVEFFTLGLLAGILAVLGTEVCLYFLQTRVFQLDYESLYTLWLLGPCCSALIIAFIGWTSTKSVVQTPPLTVLRDI